MTWSLSDVKSYESRERELSGRFEPMNRTHKQREETRKGEGKKEKNYEPKGSSMSQTGCSGLYLKPKLLGKLT